MNIVWTRTVILLGALLVLVAVNYSIYGKEQIIRTGEPIYLELAPVDPRSLMQGDYMALRFQLADAIESSLSSVPSGASQRAPIVLDDRGVAKLAPIGAESDLLIRYRIRNGRVWLGTNAYFFEEGAASRFSGTRYGEFRLDRASGGEVERLVWEWAELRAYGRRVH
jgi:uncharacterized membrane-anchored protein